MAISSVALANSFNLMMHRPSLAQASKPVRVMRGRVERDVALGDRLMLKGKFERAADFYKDAINRNSHDVPALVGYGMALGRQFKLDAAEDQFDKALALDSGNALAHAGKAMVLLNRLQSSSMTIIKNRDNTLKQCETECKKALQIDPGLPEAHYTLGMVYKEQRRFDDSSREFQEAIRQDPKYSEAYAGLGLTRLAQGNVGDAVSHFQEAIRLNSGNSTAHYGLGVAYLKQNMPDNAIKELNTALYQFRNSAPVRLAMGDAYQMQGNTVAAVREYQESIRIKPENVAAYLHIADIREARGDIEHSIAELRAGLELMPDNPELRLRIGDESLRVDKIGDAIKAYESVLAVAPQSTRAVNGLTRAYYLKAQKETTGAFVADNDFEKAEDSIKKAISLRPNDIQLRMALAKMQALSGERIDLGAVGTPTNDAERLALAETLLADNKFDEAKTQMSQVIANAPDAKQTFAVADLSLMIKDLDSAEAAYKKAGSFPGAEARAKRGLDLVSRARQQAREELNLASDLASKKQVTSAVDKYHAAVFDNPKLPQARIGLARTLERVSKPSSQELREAATQYRAYVSLEPSLPQKNRDRLLNRANKLDNKAFKIEQKSTQARRGAQL